MLHPTPDYYDLSNSKQTPPSFSPQGASVLSNMNNNNNVDNELDRSEDCEFNSRLMGQNGNINNNDRESLPSFGFTQEQVACVCEVSVGNSRQICIMYSIFFKAALCNNVE
jgi:homeobox protein SIX1